MNIFDKAAHWWLERRNVLTNPPRWVSDWLGGSETKAGNRVSAATALECSAVLACVRILSETVASLPLKVYKRLENGGKEPAPDHPLYDVLWLNPNPEMTSFEWRERVMTEACVWGNSYNQLLFDGKGNVREIWPLDPSRMAVERNQEQKRIYRYRTVAGAERTFPESDILHLSLYGDGLKGYSLIDLCKEAVGLAMGAEEFAATFYANDAAPRLFIESTAANGEQVKRMREVWNESHKGSARAHKVGWLWGGMQAKLLQANLENLQLIEARKFQLEEVARIFRVPLHLVQSLDRSTNNNIEHQGIDFVVHTIRPWLVRFEQRISKALFGRIEASRYFAEFNVDGLLRGDVKSRAEMYATGINTGWLLRNEARERENLNRIDGLDEPLIQGAMIPASKAGQAQTPKPEPKQEGGQ